MSTSTEKAIRELDKAIRSRTPVIYIVTREETRVIDAITAYAEQPVTSLSGEEILPSRQVWRWTCTKGIVPLSLVAGIATQGDAQTFDPDQTADPQVAMEQIGEYAQGSGQEQGTMEGVTANASLFLLLDMHRFISGQQDEGAGEPVFQRALRDLAGKLTATKSTAIIISPRHVELGDTKNEVKQLDWPLPDQAELEELVREIGDSLPEHIPADLNGGTKKLASALAGLTLTEAEAAILGAIYETGCLIPDKVVSHVIQAKRDVVANVAGMEYIDHSETVNTVGGLDLLKQAVAGLDQVMSAEAQEAGVEPIDGILLVGVPGCGKSLMAKAIAGGTKPCIRQNVGDQFNSLLGGTEANIRAGMQILEVIGPSVWWLDEIEKVFGGGQGETDGGTGKRVLGMMLTFMEERKERAPFVLPVVTANDVTAIPPELLNRFELVFFVDLPDEAGCAAIVDIHSQKRGEKVDIDITQDLARLAHKHQLNGREIERAVKSAKRVSYTSGRPFDYALADALENAIGVAKTMPDKIDAIRAWGKVHALPASSTQEVAAVTPTKAQLLF